MFKEIEKELLSIISDDPLEKVAHIPSKEIAKTMDLIYNIKFEDIQRVYTEKMEDMTRMVVLYSNNSKKGVGTDLCPINGKLYHITLFPAELLDKNENNAFGLTKAIISYISSRALLLSQKYDNLIRRIDDNLLNLILLQAIPLITCAVIRKIYGGPTVPQLIYNCLTESIPSYKSITTEEGINTILNLLDEDLGVGELLDNGFICAIPADDPKYPGIWVTKDENEDQQVPNPNPYGVTIVPLNNKEEE